MANSVEQLSFELTASALSEQERAVSSLRMAAGTVLGAASIAGSFLGATGGRGVRDVWVIVATIMFALCSGCAILALLPRGLVLAFSGDALAAVRDSSSAQVVDDAYRAAVHWIEPRLCANWQKIDRLASWLTISCILLGAEVISWTVSLVD